jgi:hypothetical protein
MANDYMAKLAADLDGMTMGGLASKGRYGDTMIAHINPQEAEMLMEEGGSGTINPMTGLPEFYDIDTGVDADSYNYSDDAASVDAAGDTGDAGGGDISYSDEGIGYDDSTGIGEEGPSVADLGDMDAFGGLTEEQAKQQAAFDNTLSVADSNPDINSNDPGFLNRLDNSIFGRTQNEKGENIGLTREEISTLSSYTDNPDDPRFGSYLGYNDLVDINAFQTIKEDNTRQDVAYTDRLNVEFKEKGLDAKIEPDPQNPGNYVYSGPDAAQAMFGQVFGAIGSLGKTAASMAYNASSMLPTRMITDAIIGGKLIDSDFNPVAPSLGGLIGKETGLTDALSPAINSIKSALGIGTENPADKISVNKSGEITEASREGKDINVSGVPGPEETIENILNQDAMMTPDSPEAYFGTSPQTGLPTNEQFLDMTSGDVPAYTVTDFDDPAQRAGLSDTPKFGDIRDGYNMVLQDNIQNDPAFRVGRTAPDYQALANERRDAYLSTLDLNTASTLVDPATATPTTAFVDQPDPYEYGGNEPIVRRKPRPVVSQAIDEAVTKEEKPSFPTASLPRLTEGGLKTLQYVYRNDPETLQNIYNKYALPEQYSGLKALV